MPRFIKPTYRRKRIHPSEHTVTSSLTFEEAVQLANDVLMSVIHPVRKRPDYKVKLLAHTLEDNQPLWAPLMEELRQVWGDNQIQRMINRVDEIVCTRDWEIPAERYARAKEAERWVTEHPENNSGTCYTHCCIHHGCKYGIPGCPVSNGTIQQEDPCEACGWEKEDEENARH